MDWTQLTMTDFRGNSNELPLLVLHQLNKLYVINLVNTQK